MSVDTFKTSDTAQAAFLITQGFGTPDIIYPNGYRAFFVFPKDDPAIEKSISDFDTAQAVGNIVLFFNAYQGLLRRLKER